MAAQGLPLVEDLERQIDTMLGRKPTDPPKKTGEKSLALTEENVQRMFGMSIWELFRKLAERFGYDVEEEPPKAQ